jgi:WD40 repeat protein
MMQSQASFVKGLAQQQRITQGMQARKITHKMTLGDSSSEVFCAQFDPEDRYIALGYGDGAVRIYNLETGKQSFTLAGAAFDSDHEMPVTCIRWRP